MLTRDGRLTYGLWEEAAWNYEFPNKIVHGFVVALLTTIISYQATALLLDLYIVPHRRGEARLATLFSMLLSEEGSPLSVLSALFPTRSLVALTYRRGIPEDAARKDGADFEERRLRGRVFGVFVLFLMTPPIINLVSIVITLETERYITFEESLFGGMAMGFNHTEDGGGLKTVAVTNMCRQFVSRYSETDWKVAEFFICRRIGGIKEGDGGKASVWAKKRGDGVVEVGFLVRPIVVKSETFVDVREGEGVWRLDSVVSEEDLRRVVEFAVESIREKCGSERKGELLVKRSGEGELEEIVVEQEVEFCVNDDVDLEALGAVVVGDGVRNVSVVDRVDLKLAEMRGGGVVGRFIDGGGRKIVKRRRSLVGIGWLAVLAGLFVMVRLGVGCVVSNDLWLAMEVLVMSVVVGGGGVDSMLQKGDEFVGYFERGRRKRRMNYN